MVGPPKDSIGVPLRNAAVETLNPKPLMLDHVGLEPGKIQVINGFRLLGFYDSKRFLALAAMFYMATSVFVRIAPKVS